MAIGGAFLGGGVEVVPAGSCKLELEILTEDRANLTATFTIKGTSTYTVTAGADGRAVYIVPAGQTYTVSVNTTGYDNIASQTVIAESGTVRYVRFEAFAGRVKRSGDTMTGALTVQNNSFGQYGTNPQILIGNTTRIADPKNWTTLRMTIKDNDETPNDLTITTINCMPRAEQTLLNIRTVNYNTSGIENSRCEINLYAKEDGTKYVTAPSWSVGTNDNSDKILTIKMANSLPSLVHSTGNETIAGNKTFTGVLGLLTSYPQFIVKDTDGDSTVQPSANQTPFYLQVLDKNGKAYCNLVTVTHRASDNAIVSSFGNSGRTWSGGIKLTTLPDGTEYADCPTTPSGATGKEIATANWSLGKFLKKTGDTMTGELLANGGVRSDFIRKLQSDGQNVGFVLFEETETSNIASLNARKSTGTNTAVYPYLKLFANSDGTYYATLSSNYIGQNDNSDKILTIKMANSLPSLVHTTGNETIAGLKTFTSRIVEQKSSDMGIEMLSTSFDRSATSTSYQRPVQFIARDKNSNTVMLLQTYAESNNRRGLDLMLYDMGGNHCELSLKSDGSKRYASAPTTPSDATSNEIATANWALNKFQRKITYGTGDPPSGGQAGDIYIKI